VASARLFAVTARLRDGVSPQQAQAELDAVSAQLDREFPLRQRGWRARLVFPRELWFGWLLLPLALLETAGAIVLLIACANLGVLLLARATARQAEFAMRTALGASRSRLIRQLFAEALLLSGLGGIASLSIGWACVQLLAFLQPPPGGAHASSLTLGAPTVVIAMLLSIASGLLAGAAPVLWQWRRGASLRETAERGGGTAWRGALVTVQLSLALMLLIASGLLAKNLIRVVSNDRGFDIDGLLTFDFHISPQQYLRPGGSYQGMPVGEARSTAAVIKRVHDRLHTIPGVQSMAAVSSPLVNALVVPVLPVLVPGRPVPTTPAERDALSAVHLRMTPGYLRTVRAHLLRGRDIAETDTPESPWVAVVNESMARRFWPGEDPIGRPFVFDVASGERPRTVVGIVRDMAQMLGGLGIRAVVYTSYVQQPEYYRGPFANQFGQMTFVIRGPADPAQLIPDVRRAIAEVEPGRTISNVTPLVRWGGFGTLNRGLNAAAVGGFAIVATLLACLGVYGVTVYSISQRTREIGIRLALGGQLSEIVRLLCTQAVRLIGIGAVLGGAGALGLTRFLASELPQVSPHDPAIFMGAIVLLALVAFVASLAPARVVRAINPTNALRAE
jgi:putative ABC transport system permease protein